MTASIDSVSALAERVRPVALARERVLPVVESLAGLLPEGGLVRGSTIEVGGVAATSMALAVVVEAVRQGSWAASVGLSSLGLAAAERLGMPLERLVVVAELEQGQWPTVVATLVEGFDVILAGSPTALRPADARRLIARLRERGATLILVDWPARRWVERPDLTLQTTEVHWEGIGQGWGHLAARRVAITVTGRRSAGRPKSAQFWLPAPDGRLAGCSPDNLVSLARYQPRSA